MIYLNVPNQKLKYYSLYRSVYLSISCEISILCKKKQSGTSKYIVPLLYLYINYHKFDRNFRIINERKFIIVRTGYYKASVSRLKKDILIFREIFPDDQKINKYTNCFLSGNYLRISE